LIGKRSRSAGPYNQVHDHSRPSFHASEVGSTNLMAGNAYRLVAAGQLLDCDRRRPGVGLTSMAKPANGPRSLSTGRLIWHGTFVGRAGPFAQPRRSTSVRSARPRLAQWPSDRCWPAGPACVLTTPSGMLRNRCSFCPAPRHSGSGSEGLPGIRFRPASTQVGRCADRLEGLGRVRRAGEPAGVRGSAWIWAARYGGPGTSW